MGMAACYGDKGTYGGTPICSSNTAYVPAALAADITTQGGALIVTAAPTTAYVACSKLASNSSKYVCADSTGVTKEGSTPCTTGMTACP